MDKASSQSKEEISGLIGWFAQNHVAANLMMVVVICLGLYAIANVKKESFPPFEFDRITVSVPIRVLAQRRSKRESLSRSKRPSTQ